MSLGFRVFAIVTKTSHFKYLILKGLERTERMDASRIDLRSGLNPILLLCLERKQRKQRKIFNTRYLKTPSHVSSGF